MATLLMNDIVTITIIIFFGKSIFCLNVSYTSDIQSLHAIYCRTISPWWVSIMIYSSRPLLRATYEVIVQNPSSIQLQQKFENLHESNPGPLGLESPAVTDRPRVISTEINNTTKAFGL